MTHECSSNSCHEQCCSCSNCNCHCHEEHHDTYSHELLDLADEAWMEVLKDKIKDEIKKISGDHLNQMAKLVATSNHTRWKDKMLEKNNRHEFEHQLANLLSTSQAKGKKG